jgi:hypothetical protein
MDLPPSPGAVTGATALAASRATLRMLEDAVVGDSPYGSSGSKLSRSPFLIANNVTVDRVQAPVLA